MNAWDGTVGALTSLDQAALPALALQQAALRLQWALVLAWLAQTLVLWLLCRGRAGAGLNGGQHAAPWPARRAGMVAAAVAVVAVLVLPGDWNPSYWLGLAFQWPSLFSTLLCGWLLVRQAGSGAPAPVWPTAAALPLVLLGWLLLLDTFALLPLYLYAWGFAGLPLAVFALWVGAHLLWPQHGQWVKGQQGGASRAWAVCLSAALLLHVATRLPSGNLWDAVLDPWLWLLLHLVLLRRMVGSLRGR